jgi:hypothetical protein
MLSPSTKEQPKSVQFVGSFLNRIETTTALASAAATIVTASVVFCDAMGATED